MGKREILRCGHGRCVETAKKLTTTKPWDIDILPQNTLEYEKEQTRGSQPSKRKIRTLKFFQLLQGKRNPDQLRIGPLTPSAATSRTTVKTRENTAPSITQTPTPPSRRQ